MNIILKSILLLIFITSTVYAQKGSTYKNPSSAVFDFTYQDPLGSKVIEEFNKETIEEEILVSIPKDTILTRRDNSVFQCQNGELGNPYCPTALAKANDYWDYQDGYSIKSIGTTTDYKEKITSSIIKTKSFIWILKSNRAPYITRRHHDPYINSYGTKYSFRTYAAGYWKRFNYPSSIYDYRSAVINFDVRSRSLQVQYFKDIKMEMGGLFKTNGSKGRKKYFHSYFRVYEKSCDNGYVNTGVKCEKNVVIITCPVGYVDNGLNCKNTINYSFYNYKCKSDFNIQKYDFNPISSGGNCNPLSANNLIDTNSDGIGDSCNQQTPPKNNCKRQNFYCNKNEIKPALVDGTWKCSPFLCDGTMQCGIGSCKDRKRASKNPSQLQPNGYNPLGAIFDNYCDGNDCGLVRNDKITFCLEEVCPKGLNLFEKDGKCFKKECAPGTYEDNGKCIRSIN